MTLQKGLVGHWELNSLDVKDSSAYDNDGTVNGSPSIVTGQVNNALEFDGSSDFVDIGDKDELNFTDKLSLMCWMNPSTSINDNARVVTNGRARQYAFLIDNFINSDESIVFAVDRQDLDAPNELPKNTWTHVAGTYDGSTQKLYIDGQQVNSQNFSTTLVSNVVSFKIGQDGGEFFPGGIDDVRVYDRAL